MNHTTERKLIARSWESYRAMVIPPDASEVQVAETRQAFFAGATMLFTLLLRVLDPGTEETDADMQTMAALQAEVNEFGHSLDVKYILRGRKPQ
jgi:hypothetical protein